MNPVCSIHHTRPWNGRCVQCAADGHAPGGAPRKPRIAWHCPTCRKLFHITAREADVRKFCSLSCKRRMPGPRVAAENRIQRVMFVNGFRTRDEAKAFLKGWARGRGSAWKAYKTKSRLAHVGTSAWEGLTEDMS